jgi:threonine dehydrogenase-like Zn-dependent dehydrogenase
LGHELAGELLEVDGRTGFTKGELVTFLPYYSCAHCIACRSGKPNCCAQLKVCGVHEDGGMTEYLTVPAQSLLHGNGLSYDELALVEPFAIGSHAVRRAGIQNGEFILVVGAGPIGIGIMEFARIAGARIIGLDVNESRLSFCRNVLGLKHTINAAAEDVNSLLNEITSGEMPSVVIDATGNLKSINTAFQYMSHGGKYVLVGLQKGDICFNHPEFHKREATLMSSRNATGNDFEFVIDSIRNKQIDPLCLITHKVSFEAAGEEFEGWLNPAKGVIKAMIELG